MAKVMMNLLGPGRFVSHNLRKLAYLEEGWVKEQSNSGVEDGDATFFYQKNCPVFPDDQVMEIRRTLMQPTLLRW